MTVISFIVMMATSHHVPYLISYICNSAALGGMMVIYPNVAMVIFGRKIG